jgi:hypothetical protein
MPFHFVLSLAIFCPLLLAATAPSDPPESPQSPPNPKKTTLVEKLHSRACGLEPLFGELYAPKKEGSQIRPCLWLNKMLAKSMAAAQQQQQQQGQKTGHPYAVLFSFFNIIKL